MLFENGGPNGAKTLSKLKLLVSKVLIFEILMDFGKLVFLLLPKDEPSSQKVELCGPKSRSAGH